MTGSKCKTNHKTASGSTVAYVEGPQSPNTPPFVDGIVPETLSDYVFSSVSSTNIQIFLGK